MCHPGCQSTVKTSFNCQQRSYIYKLSNTFPQDNGCERYFSTDFEILIACVQKIRIWNRKENKHSKFQFDGIELILKSLWSQIGLLFWIVKWSKVNLINQSVRHNLRVNSSSSKSALPFIWYFNGKKIFQRKKLKIILKVFFKQ